MPGSPSEERKKADRRKKKGKEESPQPSSRIVQPVQQPASDERHKTTPFYHSFGLKRCCFINSGYDVVSLKDKIEVLWFLVVERGKQRSRFLATGEEGTRKEMERRKKQKEKTKERMGYFASGRGGKKKDCSGEEKAGWRRRRPMTDGVITWWLCSTIKEGRRMLFKGGKFKRGTKTVTARGNQGRRSRNPEGKFSFLILLFTKFGLWGRNPIEWEASFSSFICC